MYPTILIIKFFWHLIRTRKEETCQFLMHYLTIHVHRKSYPSFKSTAQPQFLYMKRSHIQKAHTSDPGPRLFFDHPSIHSNACHPYILTVNFSTSTILLLASFVMSAIMGDRLEFVCEKGFFLYFTIQKIQNTKKLQTWVHLLKMKG